MHAELPRVADLMMEAFYEEKGMWKRLYQLAELNRLQQNFAYADQVDVHQMLVVVVEEDEDNDNPPHVVVGFCDIDLRPLPKDFKFQLPRPYLSDLCISTEYRRKGLAKALVEASEHFCKSHNHNELWIRVHETNEAALQMYRQGLGYDIASKALDETSKKAIEQKLMICTLHKSLA
ncbi:MAG: hypothetical protein SGARI_006812 [Bacillariaceae sp.]